MNPSLAEVEQFRGIVERCLGLRFDDGRHDFLAEVLRQRLENNARDGAADYLRRLATEAPRAEWGALGQLLTVSETYFFRHFDQFRAFADVVARDRIHSARAGRRLSILSAGCASGEETYSLAMMVRDAGLDAAGEVSILGADLNPVMISKAAGGRYSNWSLRETPAEMRSKWFHAHGRDHVLDESIRGAVRFEERNLAADAADFWRPEAYDVIFCRNMMMYFSMESARALVDRMARALAPGGYLFLGHAETLRGLSQDFHLCHTHDTFYYRRRTADEAVSHLPLTAETAQRVPLSVALEDNTTWFQAIRSSTERIELLAGAAAPVPAANAAKDAHWSLGQAFELMRRERFAEALCAVRDLPAAAAKDADAMLLMAVLYAHNGQLTEAEDACRALLKLDELNAGAHYVLALCREGAGDSRAAIGHDQAAVYLDPAFAMPRLHLGLLARRAKNPHAARRELEQALALLQREESSRLLLFGGGFGRDALLALCRTELAACGGES